MLLSEIHRETKLFHDALTALSTITLHPFLRPMGSLSIQGIETWKHFYLRLRSLPDLQSFLSNLFDHYCSVGNRINSGLHASMQFNRLRNMLVDLDVDTKLGLT
jgi:hypothetical protein